MKATLFLLSFAFAANGLAQSPTRTASSPAGLVPAGYVVVADIPGDLNKDGRTDHVLMIKGTDKTRFVVDPQRGRLDRNRRGVVIAFGRADRYELALVHPECFSSENEDGGVYVPPDLDLSIRNGVLRLHYAHGRYGYWSHDFRYQGADFVLIGHERSENRGPVVMRTASVNLLTGKVRTRVNTNRDADGEDERFRERWKSFTLARPIRLQDVADFDEFDVLGAIGMRD